VLETLSKPLGGFCKHPALQYQLLDAAYANFDQCKFSGDEKSIDENQHEGGKDPGKIRKIRHRF
jgi:hypothetical protein